MPTKPRYVLEFDLNGDPDLDPGSVRGRLNAELSGATDQAIIVGDTAVLDLDAAFRLRMRFPDNIRAIHRAVPIG